MVINYNNEYKYSKNNRCFLECIQINTEKNICLYYLYENMPIKIILLYFFCLEKINNSIAKFVKTNIIVIVK